MWRDDRTSKAPIDFASVGDGVQRQKPVRMIDPEENAIVPDTVFMDTFKIRRRVLNSLRAKLGMSGKSVNFLYDSDCHRSV